jgi:hypothetical protein
MASFRPPSLAMSFCQEQPISPSESLLQIASCSVAPQSLLQQNDQPVIQLFMYPPEILWIFKDCESDPDVNTSTSNRLRPPLTACICHKDGTLITSAEYDTIKSSGHNIISIHLTNLPEPRDKLVKGKPRSKTWYASWYRKEWLAARLDFKVQQPLLQLCSLHWKAEHILGGLLLSDTQATKTKQKQHANKVAGKNLKGKGKASVVSGSDDENPSDEDISPPKNPGSSRNGKRACSNSSVASTAAKNLGSSSNGKRACSKSSVTPTAGVVMKKATQPVAVKR